MAKPANQAGGSEWLPVPEGMWRMIVGAPTIEEKTNRWKTFQQLTFPLTLTEKEQERLKGMVGEPAQGQQQSYRVWVRGNEETAMGYMQSGKYKTSECGLAEMMCASVGAKASGRLRAWMMAGGVPLVTPGQDWEGEKAELIAFYSWFENLELYVQIRHDPDGTDPTKMWTHISAMMPIGSLPGQPEEVYCATQVAKVRMIIGMAGESDKTPDPEPEPVPAVADAIESEAPAAELSEEEKARLAAQYEAIFGKQAVPA